MWKTYEQSIMTYNVKYRHKKFKAIFENMFVLRLFYTVCVKIYSTLTPCNRLGIKKILPDSEFFEFEKSWQWITCATFTWHYYIHELSKEGGRKLGKKKTVSGGKEYKLKI